MRRKKRIYSIEHAILKSIERQLLNQIEYAGRTGNRTRMEAMIKELNATTARKLQIIGRYGNDRNN